MNRNTINRHGSRPGGEAGMALLLALLVTIILALLAASMLTRALAAGRTAGTERHGMAAFFAADGGITAAGIRLRMGRTEAFGYGLPGESGPRGAGELQVSVEALHPAGPPRIVVGAQVGGGQGAGATPLYDLAFRTDAVGLHPQSGARREVEAALEVGPVPLERSLLLDEGIGGDR